MATQGGLRSWRHTYFTSVPSLFRQVDICSTWQPRQSQFVTDLDSNVSQLPMLKAFCQRKNCSVFFSSVKSYGTPLILYRITVGVKWHACRWEVFASVTCHAFTCFRLSCHIVILQTQRKPSRSRSFLPLHICVRVLWLMLSTKRHHFQIDNLYFRILSWLAGAV